MIRLFYYSILIISALYSQEKITFIKYFQNDRDFLGDKPMLATERTGEDHIQVSYNEKRQAIIKEWMDQYGQAKKREVFSYDNEGRLYIRSILKKDNKPDKVITYGDTEPWGLEFRKYLYDENTKMSYENQRSEFQMSSINQVEKIKFYTIDNQFYGSISFRYDRLGFVNDETWVKEPENHIIRRFKYQYDIMAEIKQIWEYNKSGNLISHQILKHAPADELYKTPPPRTGNMLSEAGLIIEELRTKRMVDPSPAFIPVTLWDQLITNNDNRVDIDFVDVDNNLLKFKEPNGKEILSIPIDRVVSVVSRFGEIIYP